MENCLLNGQRICALALRNQYNMGIYELKREWKKAQYRNELICEDCGTPVELRAGDVRVPYFAHRKGFVNRDCFYETHKESEEHKEAKSILYNYFESKYPGKRVEVTKKQPNGRRSDIFIDFGNSKLVIEFQRTYIKILDWDIRHAEYEALGINDLWLLSSRILEDRVNDIDFLTQVLLHDTKDQTAKFLNVEKHTLSLLKEIKYLDKHGDHKSSKYFSQEYLLSDVTISPNGEIVCDFLAQYELAKDEYIKQCQEEELQEQLRREEFERLRIAREAKAKEDRVRQWASDKPLNPQSNSVPVQQNNRRIPNSFTRYESDLTRAEHELESVLAAISNRSSEYRETEVILKWSEQLQSIKDASGSVRSSEHYSHLVIDCDRIMMGYRNNGYIALQNAKRLELKLKLLSELVESGCSQG
jgi:competence CoiA-like predicted nuclease